MLRLHGCYSSSWNLLDYCSIGLSNMKTEMPIPTMEVVFVKGNPYPYRLYKPVTLLHGQIVNAICMTKGEQTCVFINEDEIIRRERIPVESWM